MADRRVKAKAVSGVLTTTKDGKPQIALSFELLEDDPAGHMVSWFGGFSTDKAEAFTHKALRTAGWTGVDLMDLSTIEEHQAEVYLVIGPETYSAKDDQGQPITKTIEHKVKYVNSLDGPMAIASMDEAQAKAFAAKMKGRMLALDQELAKPRTTGKPAPKMSKAKGIADPQIEDGSDIPF